MSPDQPGQPGGEAPVIALRGIQRRFRVGDQVVHALDGVDLVVARGDYLAIMGPSGSGKSTLLNILGLLDTPDAGSYHLDGQDVTTLSDGQRASVRRDRIGFVFQFFHLIPRLTAAQNVELPLTLAGLPPRERRERVARALAALGIADRAEHRPEQLSGGQRQRVAIARAMILEPSVVLADEPTGNLDSASGQAVLDSLEALNRRGITLAVVTHDPHIAERARRRVSMLDGHIVEDT
jgi:putative ABC transport system ATP-binding protein